MNKKNPAVKSNMNKVVNLDLPLYDRYGKQFLNYIDINVLLFSIRIPNIFSKLTLKDYLFGALEITAESIVRDEKVLGVWIDLQYKVSLGGEMNLTKQESNLLRSILPLRQSPWILAQMYEILGIQVGKSTRETGSIISAMPTGNKAIKSHTLES